MNQTARISLQLLSMSKSRRQKSTGSALTQCAARITLPQFFCASRRLARRRRPRLASRWHLSAAGEGVFRVRARRPQALFCRKMTFFADLPFYRLITDIKAGKNCGGFMSGGGLRPGAGDSGRVGSRRLVVIHIASPRSGGTPPKHPETHRRTAARVIGQRRKRTANKARMMAR